jgi:DNA helicase-2/ATP-dependent DNA helicase PcrA
MSSAFDISKLNPPQREAVSTTEGPVLILAGAGTGKTRVIACRITHMIEKGIDPSSIVALSFTNKAAKEMAERVRAMAPATSASKLKLGTFHSFCLNILREFPEQAGLAHRFTLAGTSDQIDLVGKAIAEKSWQSVCNTDELHALISRAKNALLSPDDIRREGLRSHADPGVMAEIYELYERQLSLHRMIDFDDCIYKTVRLLKTRPELLAKLQDRWRYLMVDEFQDTNFSQLTVVELLGTKFNNVCVVGDDDQSIYSWRGAMYETFNRFEEIFPGTKIVKLEQNYRCSNVILGAANSVIKNNTIRKDKVLWSESTDRTPIHLATLASEEAEARWIAEKCMSLLGSGWKPAHIAVLFRAGAQAKSLEMAMRECRIPTRTFGGQSFFERKEVKDFLSWLRLAVRNDDRLAFWRAVNSPPRGVGLRSLEKMEEICKKTGLTPFAVAAENPLDGFGKTKEHIRGFVEAIRSFGSIDLRTPEGFAELGKAIIRVSKMAEDIKINTENATSRERKLENLFSLPGWLESCARDLMEETEELDPLELVDRLTLESPVEGNDKKDQGNYVSLMTIHASKGLEFPGVFVCGLEEDLMPHKNSVHERQGLAEERRLFYVALTRAKTKLFLTNALERSQGGRKTDRQPSRFLSEVPIDHVEVVENAADPSAVKKRAEERRQSTVSQLAKIRESLRSGKW